MIFDKTSSYEAQEPGPNDLESHLSSSIHEETVWYPFRGTAAIHCGCIYWINFSYSSPQ